MILIKPGDTSKVGEWEAEFKCTGHGNGNKGCGAELRVSGSDLFQTYQSCMGRDQTWFATFMCPWCGDLTDIANTDGYQHANAKGMRVRIQELPFPGSAKIEAARARLRDKQDYIAPHLLP